MGGGGGGGSGRGKGSGQREEGADSGRALKGGARLGPRLRRHRAEAPGPCPGASASRRGAAGGASLPPAAGLGGCGARSQRAAAAPSSERGAERPRLPRLQERSGAERSVSPPRRPAGPAGLGLDLIVDAARLGARQELCKKHAKLDVCGISDFQGVGLWWHTACSNVLL